MSLSYSEIERVILRAVRRHYLSVRLDYRFNCLRFDSGNLEIERTQGQLTQLGASLKKAADSIGIGQKTMDAKSNQKDQLIQFYFNTMESSRQLILERKIIIEKAKEMNEQRQRQETYNRQKAKQIAERAASLAERERLMEEKKRREVDRVERKKQQEIMQKKRDIAKKMNLNMNEQQLQELTVSVKKMFFSKKFEISVFWITPIHYNRVVKNSLFISILFEYVSVNNLYLFPNQTPKTSIYLTFFLFFSIVILLTKHILQPMFNRVKI